MAGQCGARALSSRAEQGQGGDKLSLSKARECCVSALNSNVMNGGATALNSKAVEWQSIGTDMYSFGIARH